MAPHSAPEVSVPAFHNRRQRCQSSTVSGVASLKRCNSHSRASHITAKADSHGSITDAGEPAQKIITMTLMPARLPASCAGR